MSKNSQQLVRRVSINDIVTDNYYNYGKAVNTSRAIPSELDGLKPVYRRIIYSLYKMSDNCHKTVAAIGEILKIHPHGDASLVQPIAMLCHYGYCFTPSNMGGLTIYGPTVPAGSPRYTEVKLSNKLRNLIKYAITDVNMVDSDTGYEEPEAIPLPVPAVLTFDRSSGMGVGVSAVYPTFSMSSMLEALKKDNPSLLKYRGNVHINYEKSDLKELWETGKGRVTYYPDVYVKGRSVFIECTPGFINFPVNWSNRSEDGKLFNELKEQGKIYVTDLTDRNNPGLLEIAISKGVKSVDINWLFEAVKKQVEDSYVYTITTSTGEFVHQIPLKKWIKTCYDNYCKLTKKGLDRRVNELEWEKKVYNILPQVGKLLLDEKKYTNEQISKKLKVELELVEACLTKPINLLRKENHDSKIKEFDSKIAELKKITPDKLIKENML